MSPVPLLLLLVDDDPSDVFLLQNALDDQAGMETLNTVTDGFAALQYLREHHAPGTQRPDLILMDLNMPGMDGLTCLEELKRDPNLRDIPVLMFSTSDRQEDIRSSYALGASSYFQKPSHFEEYARLTSMIREYWRGFVRLPTLPSAL